MIVIKRRWHAIICKGQKGERAAVDLTGGNKMALSVERTSLRNPCGAEKTGNIRAIVNKLQHFSDRFAAQAPPLRSYTYLEIVRRRTSQTQPPLGIHAPIKQCFVSALIEPMAKLQPVFLHPGLNPVRSIEIHALDIIGLRRCQHLVRKLGRFGRHTIARHQIEMRRGGEMFVGGAQCQKGRFDGLIPPSTPHPTRRQARWGCWTVWPRCLRKRHSKRACQNGLQ